MPKKVLSQQEINKIRDLACEGLIRDGDHHKQWYLEQIAAVVTEGGLKALLQSAESQGYTIKKGICP